MNENILKQLKSSDWNKTDIHLHSAFSDGKNSIEEMAKVALELGFKTVCFTDHVRRDTNWLDAYVRKINLVKSFYPDMKILSGIEAKAIDLSGTLDVKNEFFPKIDLVIGSIHRLPKGNSEYWKEEDIKVQEKAVFRDWLRVTKGLLSNPRVDIIGHPLSFVKKRNIYLPEIAKREIASFAGRYGKIVEINLKKNDNDLEFRKILKNYGVTVLRGSDSHSVEDMRLYADMKNG